MEHLLAPVVMLWFCAGWPGLCLAFGVLVGRHGFRRAVTLILLKVFGQPPMESAS